MYKKETQKNAANDTREYDFIKGEFTASDAKEIINDLFTKKINYHKLKLFSTDIRFGVIDQDSTDRIQKLKECRKSIEEQISQVTDANQKLRIRSKISIEIIQKD